MNAQFSLFGDCNSSFQSEHQNFGDFLPLNPNSVFTEVLNGQQYKVRNHLFVSLASFGCTTQNFEHYELRISNTSLLLFHSSQVKIFQRFRKKFKILYLFEKSANFYSRRSMKTCAIRILKIYSVK